MSLTRARDDPYLVSRSGYALSEKGLVEPAAIRAAENEDIKSESNLGRLTCCNPET